MKKFIAFVPLFTILLISLVSFSTKAATIIEESDKKISIKTLSEVKTLIKTYPINEIEKIVKNEHDRISDFEQTILENPDLANVYIGLAKVYNIEGNTEKAIDYLKKAIQLAPDRPDAYVELGKILAAQGNTNEAISYIQKAIELNPEMATAYIELKRIAFNMDESDKAINYLKQAIQKSPIPQIAASLQRRIGSIYLSQGKYENAIDAYKVILNKYKNLNKDCARAQNAIAKIYYEMGNFEQAKNVLNMILQKYELQTNVYPDTLIYLGCVYFETGDSKKAIKSWEKAAVIGENLERPIEVANFLAGKISLDELHLHIQSMPWWEKNDKFFLIGIKYELEGETNKAREYYNKSLQSSQKRGDIPFLPVKRGLKRTEEY